MSNRAIAILVAVLAAWSFVEERAGFGRGPEPRVVEEIHRRIALEPGARVDVASFGGLVTVETADIEVAEIHVVRTAPTRSALERHRVVIAGSRSQLVVRAEGPPEGEAGSQTVTLRLPRSVTLTSFSTAEASPVG